MRLFSQRAGILFILVIMLPACSPFNFFYYPNRTLYIDPEHLGLKYEMVWYPSKNGNKLFGLLFRTAKEPKGIAVHFHGNFGNVSNHFLESYFLVNYGFDVLIFDYQGYGGSEGKTTVANTIEDGIASVQFAAALNRNPKGGVVILGQSLGGAVAIVTMSKEPSVKAAVIEAAFPSYRTIARDVVKRSFLTWFMYPFYPFFLTKKYDPVRHLDKIPHRPLLFVHGTADRVVPMKMTEVLYKKAAEPKEIWRVEGAGHIGSRSKLGKDYEEKIADFFSRALTSKG